MERPISSLEELVLRIVVNVPNGGASGAEVMARLSQVGRKAYPNSVYGALQRLEKEDCLFTMTQPPRGTRGGRARVMYMITENGYELLHQLEEVRKKLPLPNEYPGYGTKALASEVGFL